MELRLIWRRLRRRPVVPSAIVIAVALAVVVTSALFSVLDGLLFRPLPFQDPEALIAVEYRPLGGGPPDLPDLASNRDTLRESVAHSPLVATASQAGRATFFVRDEARDLGLEVAGVDAEFFPLLGLPPALGVTFSVDDERSPAVLSRESRVPLPVIIGHDLWWRLYGADPGVLGVRELAGRSVRIIGVMGPGVKLPGETNVWAPVASTRASPPAYIRLAPGATLDKLVGAFPDLRFKTLREAVHPGEARALPVLFGAAVILLVVTWVQVAALMFSGSLSQLHEVGVHLALGAGRVRVVRQFAIESALIASVAFGLAWLAVRPTTAFIVSLLPSELRRGQYLSPDPRTLMFACAISLLGFIVLTVGGFRVAGRVAPLALLNGRFTETSFGVERLRHALLLGQVTLTALLLYVAGLAVHSFVQAATFDYGFDAEHVLVFTPPPWARLNATSDQLFADFAEHQRKIQSSVEVLKGVRDVVDAATFYAAPFGVGIQRPDVSGPPPIKRFDGFSRSDVRARANAVGVTFVRAFGATIIEGQSFDDPEYAGRDDVAVVNETLARRLSPPIGMLNEQVAPSVIGREIQAPDLRVGTRIIGVIKDFVDTTPETPSDPQYFRPDLRSSAAFAVAIRVSPSVEGALPAIRTALERIWGPFRPRQLSFMRDELRIVLVPYRGQSILLGLIACCCLPIAAVGLMGALTYSVSVRTREIAIRIAVGADPAAVRRAVVRRALTTVGMGILVGTALGATTGSFIAHQLFQVHPMDLSAMIGVAGGLIGLAWLASVVPARLASRVDPAAVLRQG
jgi:predicted permease